MPPRKKGKVPYSGEGGTDTPPTAGPRNPNTLTYDQLLAFALKIQEDPSKAIPTLESFGLA